MHWFDNWNRQVTFKIIDSDDPCIVDSNSPRPSSRKTNKQITPPELNWQAIECIINDRFIYLFFQNLKPLFGTAGREQTQQQK